MEKDKTTVTNELIEEFKPKVERKGEISMNTAEMKKDDLNNLMDSYLISQILKKPISEVKMFRKDAFAKDYDETDLAGFVQAAWSNQVIEEVFLDLKVAALFPRVNIPRNPFKIPTFTRERKAWLHAEGISFDKRLTPTASSITFDAKVLMTAAILTDELSEDAIVPTLPLMKSDIQDAIVYSIENAILNGALSASSFDSDLTDADDARFAWNGLRKYSVANSYTLDLSTFTTKNVLALRAMMGKFGANSNDLAFIVSSKGYANFLSLDETLTLDKYGAKATIFTGEQAKFLGVPIILSEAVRDDVDATGIHSGTPGNDIYTTITLVNRQSFALGVIRDLKLEPYRDPAVGNVIYASTRLDFEPRIVTTEPVCVTGIKVS